MHFIWPFCRYTPYILQANLGLQALAGSMNQVTYAYCGNVFLSDSGALRSDLLPDGIHPSATGAHTLPLPPPTHWMPLDATRCPQIMGRDR